MSGTCSICNGTGCAKHHAKNSDGSSESYWTTPCECRTNLPRREGKAAWWTSDKSYSESITTECEYCTVDICLTPELPISEDNYPLLRTQENCYWPCGIGIEWEGDSVLLSDDLRALAAFFTKMADKADELNKPVEIAEQAGRGEK